MNVDTHEKRDAKYYLKRYKQQLIIIGETLIDLTFVSIKIFISFFFLILEYLPVFIISVLIGLLMVL